MSVLGLLLSEATLARVEVCVAAGPFEQPARTIIRRTATDTRLTDIAA